MRHPRGHRAGSGIQDELPGMQLKKRKEKARPCLGGLFCLLIRQFLPRMETKKVLPSLHTRSTVERPLPEAAFSRSAVFFRRMPFTSRRISPSRIDPLLFCTEARTLELSEMANGMLGGAECVSCRKVQSEQIFRLQEQIREIEGKSREWEELADSFSKELDFQKQQNYTLRNYADTLRISFRNSTGKVTDEEVTLPDDYESLPEWVEKNLSGRLLLLPRAVRSVKNAFYKDVSLVYNSLLLLAEEYRNMRLGFDTGKTFFEKRISELGVELGGSISNVSAGEYEDRYFVNYPTDSSSKRKLDFHLKKGNTKDDKFCMRIYFFWDEETNQVVVAHLPSHLESRMT